MLRLTVWSALCLVCIDKRTDTIKAFCRNVILFLRVFCKLFLQRHDCVKLSLCFKQHLQFKKIYKQARTTSQTKLIFFFLALLCYNAIYLNSISVDFISPRWLPIICFRNTSEDSGRQNSTINRQSIFGFASTFSAYKTLTR